MYMPDEKCLCIHCLKWVNCDSEGDSKSPYGFCLVKDLYTYTACERCSDYTEGEPFTESEFETFV